MQEQLHYRNQLVYSLSDLKLYEEKWVVAEKMWAEHLNNIKTKLKADKKKHKEKLRLQKQKIIQQDEDFRTSTMELIKMNFRRDLCRVYKNNMPVKSNINSDEQNKYAYEKSKGLQNIQTQLTEKYTNLLTRINESSKDVSLLHEIRDKDIPSLTSNEPLMQSFIGTLRSFLHSHIEAHLRQLRNLSRPAPKPFMIQCPICLDDVPFQSTVHMGCPSQHRYCENCLEGCILHSLQDWSTFPFRCPSPDCNHIVDCEYAHSILKNQDQKILILFRKLQFINLPGEVGKYIACPSCTAVYFETEDFAPHQQCKECKQKFCAACRVQWHEGLTCDQFKNVDAAHQHLLDGLAKQNKWKKCLGCKTYVAKALGCNHIICHCGTEFCYICEDTQTLFGKSHPPTEKCQDDCKCYKSHDWNPSHPLFELDDLLEN